MKPEDDYKIHKLMASLCGVMRDQNPDPAVSITAITGVLILAISQVPDEALQPIVESTIRSIREGSKNAPAIRKQITEFVDVRKKNAQGGEGSPDKGDN